MKQAHPPLKAVRKSFLQVVTNAATVREGLKVVYAVCFSLDLELLEDDPDLEVAVFQS